MSNKKITDLTELTNPTTDDVFPIVDIATNTTQKVQVGNLPIQTAVTTALATKQATLVSGTNIKTINGASLLGSGDIPVVTSPSGVAGAIQFSNGSAFASDASNLFWDDTNNRLGVGTNAPNTALDISASLTSIFTLRNGATNFITTRSSGIGSVDTGLRIWSNDNNFTLDIYGSGTYNHDQRQRFLVNSAERLLLGSTIAAKISGSGSTSATTSLLVQNSAGSDALKITDDRVVNFYNQISGPLLRASNNIACSKYYTQNYAGQYMAIDDTLVNVNFGVVSAVASAQVQIDSTTRGFLPPRMTTTQKNAIATPAAGLVVYDNTTNKLCCYNGSTWNDLF